MIPTTIATTTAAASPSPTYLMNDLKLSPERTPRVRLLKLRDFQRIPSVFASICAACSLLLSARRRFS